MRHPDVTCTFYSPPITAAQAMGLAQNTGEIHGTLLVHRTRFLPELASLMPHLHVLVAAPSGECS